MKTRTHNEEFEQLSQENARLRQYVNLARESIRLADANFNELTELKIQQRKLVREIDRLNRRLSRTKGDWWKYLLAGVIVSACVFLIVSGVISLIVGASLLGFGFGWIEALASITFGVIPLLFGGAKFISYNASEKKLGDHNRNESYLSPHIAQRKGHDLNEIQMVNVKLKKSEPASSLPSAAGFFKVAPESPTGTGSLSRKKFTP